MSARAIDVSLGVKALCVRALRTLALGRCSPAWLAAFLILVASPLWAQTFTPSANVGVGIQTSYQNVDPTGGNDLNQFALGPRSYLFERNDHAQYQRHVQHGLQHHHQQHGHIGRGGSSSIYRPSSTSGSAVFFHPATAPTSRSVLLQRVGRIYGRHPGRLSRRLSRPRQWRGVLGRLQSGDSQNKSLGGRIRRRFRRREFGCHLGRPRSDSISGIRRAATT